MKNQNKVNPVNLYDDVNTALSSILQDNLLIEEFVNQLKYFKDIKNQQINYKLEYQYNKLINNLKTNRNQSIRDFKLKFKKMTEIIETCEIIKMNKELIKIKEFMTELTQNTIFRQDIQMDLSDYLIMVISKIYIYDTYIKNKMVYLKNSNNQECTVCYETPEYIVKTKCNHYNCENCIYKIIESTETPMCSICRRNY
jgi:hypothetical protein